MKLDFFSDPGHGWLKVKLSMLEGLSIAEKITRFSYQRGEWVYLEEDLDMRTFLDAAKHWGINVELRERVSFKRSRIRNYERYNKCHT